MFNLVYKQIDQTLFQAKVDNFDSLVKTFERFALIEDGIAYPEKLDHSVKIKGIKILKMPDMEPNNYLFGLENDGKLILLGSMIDHS